MYRKAQLFEERLHKIGSGSTLMDLKGNQSGMLGDPNKEYYAAFTQTRESRQQLNNLLQEVINVRQKSADSKERADLFRMEQKIKATLKAGKKMTPKHRMTLSQVFMTVAEQTINHDVFQAIMNKTHELYHSPDNIDSTRTADGELRETA